MNKLYFYIFYIPIGATLIFSIGPYLKNRKYQNDKKEWDVWVNEHLLDNSSIQACNFCKNHQSLEEVAFRLPKTIKKSFFSFSESVDFYSYISVRCRICQSELGRKMI
jgi:hypothetical protein